jgi:DNA-binding transcriptional regulator YdaS (Cro superfamily)
MTTKDKPVSYAAKRNPPTRLRVRVVELGRSQRVIAAALGVSPSALNLWINGRKRIPARYVKPLAQQLKVPAATVQELSDSVVLP